MRTQVEFTFFEWLTLYSWPLRGTVKSSASPQPVLGSLWRNREVSTLHFDNCANARQIHVFWVINPLFLTPLGNGRNVNHSTTLSQGVIDVPVKFQLFILKTVRMHVEFTFFEWLTLYFWPLWGYGRNVNSSTTCPGLSMTYLWSFIPVSWKLCECIETDRDRQTETETDNPLYRYRYILWRRQSSGILRSRRSTPTHTFWHSHVWWEQLADEIARIGIVLRDLET